ncbi:MAG: serine/threonine-protein kinase [Acidobacteriota bacterium]
MKHPSHFGRYEVLKLLGRGAMGKVFLARDPVIGREVAIKVFDAHAGLEGDELEEVMGRFQREFRSAGTLTHPNVVTVYDVGQQDDHPFMAMEYVVGESLESILRAGRTLTFKEVSDLAAQIGAALDYAHDKGIVHRDVKPANTMITWDGIAKLTDFGVAKMASSTMTRTGTIVGTPAYMAPEQITGYEVTGASDQFSLAVILYQLLTGERPFTGDSPTAILYKIVHDTPSLPQQLNHSLPALVNDVLMRSLAKDPRHRYPSCLGLAEAVREALGAAPSRPGAVGQRSEGQHGEGRHGEEPEWAGDTLRMDGEEVGSIQDATQAGEESSSLGPELVMATAPKGRGVAVEPKKKKGGGGLRIVALLVLAAAVGLAIWQQAQWMPLLTGGLGSEEQASTSSEPESPEVPQQDDEPSSPRTQPPKQGDGFGEDEAPLRLVLPIGALEGGEDSAAPLEILVDGQPAERDDAGDLLLLGGRDEERRIEVRRGETLLADGVVRLADLESRSDTWIEALAPDASQHAISIDSRPQGARVLVDGEAVGETPFTLEIAEDAAYDLRLELEDHKATGMRLEYENLSPDLQQAGRLFFPLERDIAPGVISVVASYPVAVILPDGSRQDPRASHSLSLDPGSYRVRLEAPQVFFAQDFDVEVVSGETIELPTPATVAITVTAVPGNCRVSIDGQEVDFTPLRDLPVAVGSHEITFYWPGLDRTETRTELISAENRQITARASR